MHLFTGLAATALVALAAPALAEAPQATHTEIWQPGGKQPFKAFKPIKKAAAAECRTVAHHRPAGKLPHHPAAERTCAAEAGTKAS